MYDFEITTAALRPASMPTAWQPSALGARRGRTAGNCTPDTRLASTHRFTHYNSTVPTMGAVSAKAGVRGAAKQAAPPRGVPR